MEHFGRSGSPNTTIAANCVSLVKEYATMASYIVLLAIPDLEISSWLSILRNGVIKVFWNNKWVQDLSGKTSLLDVESYCSGFHTKLQ